MLPLLVVLAALQQGRPAPPQVPPATTRVLPAVAVWLADSNLAPGSRGRAFVRMRQAGYLVLLRVDGAGRISVIFPASPLDDARIPGGATYEIPGPDGRAAFTVREAAGAGTVLAARSATPLDVGALAAGERWDDHALLFEPTAGDPIAALLDIVDRLTDGRAYDADAAAYAVTGSQAVAQNAGASTIFPITRSRAPAAPPALLMMPAPGSPPAAAAPVTVNADCSGAIISDGSACAAVTYNAAPAAQQAPVETYYQPAPPYDPYLYYDPFYYRNRQRRALRDTVTPAPKDHAIALTMRRPVMPVFRRREPIAPTEPTVTTTTPIVRIVTPAGGAGPAAQTTPAPAAPATTTSVTRLVPMRMIVPGDGRQGRASTPAAEPAAAPSAPVAAPSSGGTIAYPRALPLRRPYRRP